MNDVPKIEKNIPIPDRLIRYGKNIDFLKQLNIGDSFVVEKNRKVAITGSARRTKIKLTTRSLGNGKFRIWRIK